ncbi:MAG: glycosyltransferase [Thermoanaerobaculia bacterium]
MTVRTTPFRPTLSTLGVTPPTVALSVVLPCYKAGALARSSVMRLTHAFAGRIPSYEIIVVDDGIGDCERVLRDLPPGPGGQLHVITLPENRGKGGAVAAGMKAATGLVRVFTDIDVPYGTTPIMLVESLIRNRGFHVVIGDRTFPQSRYETAIPFGRRMASAFFSKLTATLVTGGFFDTQCGLKGFRGDIAEALFGLQSVERFAFDVELLYLALSYGLEIKRIPVMLESSVGDSTVRIGRDSLQTFLDLARIKRNQMRGAYENAALASIVALECHAGMAALRTPVAERRALRVER